MARVKLKVSHDNQIITLRASGDLNVQHAQQLKAKLLEILETPAETHLALEGVTSIDTAAIQLIFLFRKALTNQNYISRITLPESPAVQSLLEKTGVTKFL
ncbi:MAG TPA: STAS domain-containing protein [Ohtaekwangia sp.]|uniref:STAS domain-containing protein n=1 Tax=Ohtaekwangia sp. TaxID=2066019 RepID=UPI002F944562